MNDEDEDTASETERAEAEALARALDGDAGAEAPEDALQAALFLRHGGARGELAPDRAEEILQDLLGDAPRVAQPRKRSRLLRWSAIGGALAAGAVVGLLLTTQAHPAIDLQLLSRSSRSLRPAPACSRHRPTCCDKAPPPEPGTPRSRSASSASCVPTARRCYARCRPRIRRRSVCSSRRGGRDDAPAREFRRRVAGMRMRARRVQPAGRAATAQRGRRLACARATRTRARRRSNCRRRARARAGGIADCARCTLRAVSQQHSRVVLQDLLYRVAMLDVEHRPEDAVLETERGLLLGRHDDIFCGNLLAARGRALAALGRDTEAASSYHEALEIDERLLPRCARPRPGRRTMTTRAAVGLTCVGLLFASACGGGWLHDEPQALVPPVVSGRGIAAGVRGAPGRLERRPRRRARAGPRPFPRMNRWEQQSAPTMDMEAAPAPESDAGGDRAPSAGSKITRAVRTVSAARDLRDRICDMNRMRSARSPRATAHRTRSWTAARPRAPAASARAARSATPARSRRECGSSCIEHTTRNRAEDYGRGWAGGLYPQWSGAKRAPTRTSRHCESRLCHRLPVRLRLSRRSSSAAVRASFACFERSCASPKSCVMS